MKKYIKYLAICSVLAAAFLTGCDKDNKESGSDGPSVVWTNSDGSKTYDFSQRYASTDVEVLIKAATENQFTGFTVDILGDVLTSEELAAFGLSSHLDLINPGEAAEALGGLGFPTGNGITSKKSFEFDITTLIGLLPMLGTAGDCDFKLTLTDESGTTVKTLKLSVVVAPGA